MVEEIDVRRRAGLHQVDDAPGFGRVVQGWRAEPRKGPGYGLPGYLVQQRRERGESEGAADAGEELAAGLTDGV